MRSNAFPKTILFPKVFSLLLAVSVLASCAGGQKAVISDTNNAPRTAACSDYTPFRYFYTRQKGEGLSGWEIAYLLSLGYSPEELTAMDFEQKRQLLLPGVTGISGDSGHYDKLHPSDQEKLTGYGMTPEDYEGLAAIGFENAEWLSQEKIKYLLPLDGLRERLEPDPAGESVFFDGYQKLFEDRWDLEQVEAVYTAMEERGVAREETQFLRNMGMTFEEMPALPETELQNLLWDLPRDASREQQLSALGYAPEEFYALSAEEEAYIFPFENLLSKLEDDGFSWATIHSIERDSEGTVTHKMIIRFVLSTKQK